LLPDNDPVWNFTAGLLLEMDRSGN
jgi:hypothetical protein